MAISRTTYESRSGIPVSAFACLSAYSKAAKAGVSDAAMLGGRRSSFTISSLTKLRSIKLSGSSRDSYCDAGSSTP